MPTGYAVDTGYNCQNHKLILIHAREGTLFEFILLNAREGSTSLSSRPSGLTIVFSELYRLNSDLERIQRNSFLGGANFGS